MEKLTLNIKKDKRAFLNRIIGKEVFHTPQNKTQKKPGIQNIFALGKKKDQSEQNKIIIEEKKTDDIYEKER